MADTQLKQYAHCWQAYNRKQGHREANNQQVSSTADGDEADSDSTSSRSSSDINVVGKANGAGGDLHASEQQTERQQTQTNSAANGAFNTAALSKKFSANRPPGGKVQWSTCNMLLHVLAGGLAFVILASVSSPHSRGSNMHFACASFSLSVLQLSKKQLMERAKEEKRKSSTGDLAKSGKKVGLRTCKKAFDVVKPQGNRDRLSGFIMYEL